MEPAPMPEGRSSVKAALTIAVTIPVYLAVYEFLPKSLLEHDPLLPVAMFVAVFSLAGVASNLVVEGRARVPALDEMFRHLDRVSAARAVEASLVAIPSAILVAAAVSGYVGESPWLAGFVDGLFTALVFIAAAFLASYLREYRRYVG